MKKIKYLVLLVVMMLIVPFTVFADEEETAKEDNKEVKVYFFRGQGCSHCAEAEEWFKSIEEEYGERFKIVDYETWYNEENADLMKKVAKARGEEDRATGVPYIIIGDKSWIGFAEDYKDEIKGQIDSVYGTEIEKRYDIMDLMSSTTKKEEKKDSDVVSLIIVLLVVGGIGFGIYKARQKTN